MIDYKGWEEMKTIEKLKEVAKKIKHSGDYGHLFWNPTTKEAHWTMADSDGYDPKDPDPLTSEEKIKSMFGKVKNVSKVIVGDEWSPKDPSWIRIDYKESKK